MSKNINELFFTSAGLQPLSVFVWSENALLAKSELCMVLCDAFHIIERYLSTELHFIVEQNAALFHQTHLQSLASKISR